MNAMNGLTQQDVIRTLRIMGLGPSDMDAIKLNDFGTNQAEVMFKDDVEIDVTDLENKIKNAGINAIVSKFESLEEVLVLYRINVK